MRTYTITHEQLVRLTALNAEYDSHMATNVGDERSDDLLEKSNDILRAIGVEYIEEFSEEVGCELERIQLGVK